MTSLYRYPDTFLWVLIYPLIASSFIFIANDNTFEQLVQIPSFKTDLLFALVTTYAVGGYIKWITLKLDQSISKENFKQRLKHQLTKGLIIPLFVALMLEVIYLHFINIPLSKSSILNLELPLMLLFLSLINAFYMASYLFHNRKTEIVTVIEKVMLGNESIKYIAVQKGYGEEKIDLDNCAFIKSANKILWLYTFDGNQFRINGTLEEWETKLNPFFFKINRQYLASSAAIKSISQTDTRKISVNFCLTHDDDVYISKENAVNFKKWWKKDCPF